MASKETSIFKQKSNYIESSVIQNLPKRCGVLIGLEGLPKLAYSSPVIVNKLEKITISAPSLKMKSKNFSNIIDNKISERHVEIEDSQSGLKDFLSKMRKDTAGDIIDNTSIDSLDHGHNEGIE